MGKYLPLVHFMPGPWDGFIWLIVDTLSAGIFIHPWGKRGEEKIENPDLPVVFYADICRVMLSGSESSSHEFYALVLIL